MRVGTGPDNHVGSESRELMESATLVRDIDWHAALVAHCRVER